MKMKLKITKGLKEYFPHIQEEAGQIEVVWTEDGSITYDGVSVNFKFKKQKDLEEKGVHLYKLKIDKAVVSLELDFPDKTKKIIPKLIRKWASEIASAQHSFSAVGRHTWQEDLEAQRKQFIKERLPLAKEVIKALNERG